MTPLRVEHRELLPEIAALRAAADAVGLVTGSETRARVAACLTFLRDHLRPHAQAEDEVLYPAVAKLMGSADAVATMRRDHVEVLRLTEELDHLYESMHDDTVNGAVATDLRRLLYGLFAVISLHFAKEEEVYLPILEQGLTPEQADHLFHDMGALRHPLAGTHAAHDRGRGHQH